jgi:hypothetical protein
MLVLVELVPDELTISEPDSVALYPREFDRLRSAAVFRNEARVLLDRIAEDMRQGVRGSTAGTPTRRRVTRMACSVQHDPGGPTPSPPVPRRRPTRGAVQGPQLR